MTHDCLSAIVLDKTKCNNKCGQFAVNQPYMFSPFFHCSATCTYRSSLIASRETAECLKQVISILYKGWNP